jgi:integrase
MTASKRNWQGADGKKHEAWSATFYAEDETGIARRHRKSGFKTKREAEDWEREEHERLKQVNLAPPEKTKDLTIAGLCQEWLDAVEQGHGERPPVEFFTWKKYEVSVRLHIRPLIGDKPLARFNLQEAVAFRKRLLQTRKRVRAQAVLTHLRMALNFAVEQGYLPFNPAQAVRIVGDTRTAKALKMPTKAQMRSIVAELEKRASAPPRAGKGEEDDPHTWLRFGALYILLQGSGLRISEARGLAWSTVDLDAGSLKVVQRVDNRNVMGKVKSKAAIREIMLDDLQVSWLRRWKAVCPPSDLNLVFPTSTGRPIYKSNLYHRYWVPLCKVVRIMVDRGDGTEKAPYGFHGARHFRVSQLIGSGANQKDIMTEIGHAKISLTMETYGHLFPDDREQRRERANRIAQNLVTNRAHEEAN